jgi:hypothetical protein
LQSSSKVMHVLTTTNLIRHESNPIKSVAGD